MVHAKAFLRAQLVGPLRNDDNKPYVAHSEWNKMFPVEAKLWRKDKLEALFPSLYEQRPNLNNPQPPQPPAPDASFWYPGNKPKEHC